MTQEELKMELEELAVRFSKGWHEGIKIDASDIMLLNEAAQALAQPEQEPVAILNHAHGVYTFRNVNLKGLPDGEYLVYTHPPQRTEQSGWRKKQIDDAEEEAWKEMEKKAVYSPFIVSELWRLSK